MQGDSTIIVKAATRIAEGEELTISYIDESLTHSERQAALVDYGFECGCMGLFLFMCMAANKTIHLPLRCSVGVRDVFCIFSRRHCNESLNEMAMDPTHNWV
ncbi:hypothetical protein SARC_14137 [Sphaeroforma arctica JP610]|uniref:SET domain-containing protein n=1 Tax=Sphaeroforma arctica JP610 TaxID=667725 RepID=A0A0L0F9A2_9EUKA|nr:hypothetical protein SARC_14137 [Sphaeroforma arctica JP610]KNC73304.1 hypothetical protein SARC_14137 [Sphaeroforma arctica JP610]|eukprot:XP_014147206.1 hypothetical protein SARC_14137 [Sphaeroforma arctica JP610]